MSFSVLVHHLALFFFVSVVRAKVDFILSNMSRIDQFLQTWAGVDFEALFADYAVDTDPAEPDEQPEKASPVTPAVSPESVEANVAEHVAAENVAEQSTDASASTASGSAAPDTRPPITIYAVPSSSRVPARPIAPAAKKTIRQQQRESKA